MKLYKLTDAHGQTYGKTQWGEGVEHTAPGTGKLCGPGWIHAYEDLLVGVFLNPIHGDFKRPQAWECEGDVGADDHGLKVGCTRLRTLHRVPLPEVTMEQQVRFGILCARTAYTEPSWVAWADGWLDGSDRTAAAARAAEAASWAAEAAAGAARSARAAARSAAWAARAEAARAAAADWAAWAAWAAAWAARAEAARAAEEDWAAWATAWAAAEAARAAEEAARAAAGQPLDLPALARAAWAAEAKR